MKYLLLLLLLFPTLAPAEEQRIIRDRTGSFLYTVDRHGNEIIYRDRGGDMIAAEAFHGPQRDRDQVRGPLWEDQEED